jgi:putative Holliday junction resolvase
MSTERRLMGIDHGETRIGVALSDPFGIFAQPFRIIPAQPEDDAISTLCHLAAQEEVVKIVVGLPTDTSGAVGFQAMRALAWARELARHTGIPIVFWDESFSSVEAENHLRRRHKRGEPVDHIAAAAILQDYLDSGGGDYEPGKPLDSFPTPD